MLKRQYLWSAQIHQAEPKFHKSLKNLIEFNSMNNHPPLHRSLRVQSLRKQAGNSHCGVKTGLGRGGCIFFVENNLGEPNAARGIQIVVQVRINHKQVYPLLVS